MKVTKFQAAEIQSLYSREELASRSDDVFDRLAGQKGCQLIVDVLKSLDVPHDVLLGFDESHVETGTRLRIFT